MKSFLLRSSLPLAIVVYAITLADVSSGVTLVASATSIAIGVLCAVAGANLYRISSLTQSAVPIILLAASFLSIASRIAGYETVVHTTREEWGRYQRELGLSIADDVSNTKTITI